MGSIVFLLVTLVTFVVLAGLWGVIANSWERQTNRSNSPVWPLGCFACFIFALFIGGWVAGLPMSNAKSLTESYDADLRAEKQVDVFEGESGSVKVSVPRNVIYGRGKSSGLSVEIQPGPGGFFSVVLPKEVAEGSGEKALAGAYDITDKKAATVFLASKPARVSKNRSTCAMSTP